jgi:hypothetical protein
MAVKRRHNKRGKKPPKENQNDRRKKTSHKRPFGLHYQDT